MNDLHKLFDEFDSSMNNQESNNQSTEKNQLHSVFDEFDNNLAVETNLNSVGGFVSSAKQSLGSTIKGAGQVISDIGITDKDNFLKNYGQEIIAANPTAVKGLGDILDKPIKTVTEAVGNAAGSIVPMLGVRALGQGITAAAPFTGPAAPIVAGLGQAVAFGGPAVMAALPSFGGIREVQETKNPESNFKDKAIAALGAATVGIIESKFGPQDWALKMTTEAGRKQLAGFMADKTIMQAIGKGGIKGAAIEGAEELVQSPVEQLAGYDNPLTKENLTDTAFGSVMGAVGGGVLGGAMGPIMKGSNTQETKTPQELELDKRASNILTQDKDKVAQSVQQLTEQLTSNQELLKDAQKLDAKAKELNIEPAALVAQIVKDNNINQSLITKINTGIAANIAEQNKAKQEEYNKLSPEEKIVRDTTDRLNAQRLAAEQKINDETKLLNDKEALATKQYYEEKDPAKKKLIAESVFAIRDEKKKLFSNQDQQIQDQQVTVTSDFTTPKKADEIRREQENFYNQNWALDTQKSASESAQVFESNTAQQEEMLRQVLQEKDLQKKQALQQTMDSITQESDPVIRQKLYNQMFEQPTVKSAQESAEVFQATDLKNASGKPYKNRAYLEGLISELPDAENYDIIESPEGFIAIKKNFGTNENSGIAESSSFINEQSVDAVKRAEKPKFKPVNPTSKPFKQWFAGSQITDDNGNPLLVYHGSPTFGINENAQWAFDSNKLGKNVHSSLTGLGHFFATDINESLGYTEGAKGKLHTVYLNIKNPLEMNSWEFPVFNDSAEARAFAKRKELQGYDGFFIKDEGHYVAFEPNQIKSGEINTGEFDPTNPDIRFQTTEFKNNNPWVIIENAYGDWKINKDFKTKADAESWFGKNKIKRDRYGNYEIIENGTTHLILRKNDLESSGYSLPKFQATNQADLSKVNLDDIKKAFPNQEVSQAADGKVSVKFNNGQGLTINSIQEAGQGFVKLAIETGQMSKTGKILGITVGSEILLDENFADNKTLWHENKHVLDNLGMINAEDDLALNREFNKLRKAGKLEFALSTHEDAKQRMVENRANMFAQIMVNRESYRNTPFGKVIQRIMDFFQHLLSFGKQSVSDLAREVESGKIYERQAANQTLEGKELMQVAQAFYSRLQSAIFNDFPTELKAQKVIPYLKSKLKNTNEQRPYQEIQAIGLDAWLAAKNPADIVTKEELSNFVKANMVEFEDVILRGDVSKNSPYLQSEITHFDQYTEPGAVEGSYREMFVTVPGTDMGIQYDENERPLFDASGTSKKASWQDGHSQYSDITNPIVRIRFNEVSADGKRILRIEEMQGPSDTNQKKMPLHLKENIYQLGVKRIIAYAKENGFDGVALSTKPEMSAGETQADRYSLEKQVNQIYAKPLKNGKFYLEVNGKDGDPIYSGDVLANELENHIGKELSRKIISDNGGTYSGLDLKVGGEGLKKLYDNQLPKMLESYGNAKFTSAESSNIQEDVPVSKEEALKSLAKGEMIFIGNEIADQPSEIENYQGDIITVVRPMMIKYLPITAKSSDSFSMFQVSEQKIPQAIYDELHAEKSNLLKNYAQSARIKYHEMKLLADKALGSISTRLGLVDDELPEHLRQLDFDTAHKIIAILKPANKILDITYGKKNKLGIRQGGMSAIDRDEWNIARLQSDEGKIEQISQKYNMKELVAELREKLNQVRLDAEKVGYDVGFIDEYWPRVIKDREGFLQATEGISHEPVFTQAFREQAKKLGITQEEFERDFPTVKADIISNIILGKSSGISGPGNIQGRVFETIPKEYIQFYMDADAALMQYVYSMTKKIEARKFFGKVPTRISNLKAAQKRKTADLIKFEQLADMARAENPERLAEFEERITKLKEDLKLIEEPLNLYKIQDDYSDNIGTYIDGMRAEGRIKPKDEKMVSDILKARFNEHGTTGIVNTLKNAAYIDVMGNPLAAITQIGDLAWAMYVGKVWTPSGFISTGKNLAKAVMNKSNITKEDLGIERIAQEFADGTTMSKAVSKVFKMVGLEKMDSIGKEVLINNALDQFKIEAKKNPEALAKKIRPIFKGKSLEVVQEILAYDPSSNSTIEPTENLKRLLYSKVLDFQPIALSAMTEGYLTGGNYRAFYMLKTYSLQQFDVFRREVFHNIKSDDPQRKIQGITNMIQLAALLTLANAGADEIKDFMLGKETKFSDNVIENLLVLVGASRYIKMKISRDGLGSTLSQQILPPMHFVNSASKDLMEGYDNYVSGDTSKFDHARIIDSIPGLGKLYYWHAGRGADLKKSIAEQEFTKAGTDARLFKKQLENSTDKRFFIESNLNRFKQMKLQENFQAALNRNKAVINKLEKIPSTENVQTRLGQLKFQREQILKKYQEVAGSLQ